MSAGPLVALPPGQEYPYRQYALFRGRLTDIDEWETFLGADGGDFPPALVWPADRSWCFARDVDPHWAGIVGSQAAVDALVADTYLDVVVVRPGDAVPTYY
ncbi:hypothetical protein [Sanguibacter gelidistatuariae]|nr:hypothetical protein [Sanguibacter gelidistatuariae]